MSEKVRQSSSHERKETAYLDRSNHTFLYAYAKQTGDTKSRIINYALKELKNKIEGKKTF